MIKYKIDNLAKHDITTIEVDEVLNDSRTVWLDLGVSRSGNDRLMFVGLTRTGRVLEVGIEFINEDEYVFHALDAGQHYLKDLNDAQ